MAVELAHRWLTPDDRGLRSQNRLTSHQRPFRIDRLQKIGVIRRGILDAECSRLRSDAPVLLKLAVNPLVLEGIYWTVWSVEESNTSSRLLKKTFRTVNSSNNYFDRTAEALDEDAVCR